VLGDETQPAGEDGVRSRATSGPRHAAPRKSMLTKLHVPAGKAVALAAMPTAVLMGMGLTPHFAQADEQPSSPFKPGPCVTQSDTPTATPSATAGKAAAKSGKAHASATPTASPSAGSGGTGKAGTPGPTVSPSASASAAAKTAAGLAAQAQSKPGATTTPTPTPTTSTAPPDLLGLGNLLGGLLGLNKPTPTPTPTTKAPAPPATTAPATPDPGTTQAPPSKPSSGATKGSTPPVGQTVKGLADGAASAAKKAVKDLTAAAGTPSPAASPGATAGTTAGGKQPYPCPTYDAKALANAQTESGIPLLPDQPWTLKSNLLTLYGLSYHGIVQVRTWSGTVKDVMKFTASGVDIGNLQQVVQGPRGTTTHVNGRTGSTSTIRNGTVTMYTESLSGNLLGLVPITFTPKAPPPLTLPVLFFTNATVIQAGQFGGTLHVPGMQVIPNQPAA
jgi:hypothetical protein